MKSSSNRVSSNVDGQSGAYNIAELFADQCVIRLQQHGVTKTRN